MKIIQDTHAQAGGIVMVVLGLFVVGFLYVAFGAIMAQFQTTNNEIITAGEIPYSQDHWDTMDIIFKYWWAVPIYAILLFAIYAIKNALTKDPTEI